MYIAKPNQSRCSIHVLHGGDWAPESPKSTVLLSLKSRPKTEIHPPVVPAAIGPHMCGWPRSGRADLEDPRSHTEQPAVALWTSRDPGELG